MTRSNKCCHELLCLHRTQDLGIKCVACDRVLRIACRSCHEQSCGQVLATAAGHDRLYMSGNQFRSNMAKVEQLEYVSMPEPAESLGVPELHDRLQ